MMIGTIIILVLALDQMTKFLIRANFIVGETLPMIPDILHLTYVRNTGAAFSMFRNMPVVTVGSPLPPLGDLITLLYLFAIARLSPEGTNSGRSVRLDFRRGHGKSD